MQTKEKTGRVKLHVAADRLGISTRTLNSMIAKNIFTMKQDAEGGPRYLLSDELDLWIETVGTPEEIAAALREFRIRKKRIKK